MYSQIKSNIERTLIPCYILATAALYIDTKL